MIPILYDTINEGTVPSHFGIGALTDTLAASVNEERNGSFELSLTYAAQGIHANEIKVGRYIKAKPNFTDDAQLFRIYQVGKAMNGRFEVSAEHVSYLLSGKPITSGTANNCASACAVLSAQAGNFTISTTKTTAGDFAITAPSSVRSWFGGKTGSLLDVYGGGEWHYDNFTCTLKEHRGVVSPIATIRYKKNLTEFNQEIDASNLYTHVLCYYQADATKVVGNEVATGLSGTKRVLILDKTSDYQITPDITDLDNDATTYIASHNLTTPESNFTLNFVQSGQLFDRVDLCDMVNVYFEPLGITATVKCIRVKWDVLKGRYIETEFGTPTSNITDTLADNNKAIAEAESAAAEAINQVGSKKRVFISTPVPPYDVGDLWTDSNDLYYCTNPRTSGEVFAEEDWELATDYVGASTIETAISAASDVITGTAGGFVVWHDSNNDGQPDEILIMDTANIDTATKVWRWNAGGLAFSPNGYAGPYNSAAITSTGQINASSITTGSLDASQVTIQHLTATMFEGGKLTLGGLNNQAGIFELLNDQGIVIGEMNKDGLKFYGDGPEGSRPYVVLNNTDGLKGYDANDTAIFWVNRDEFTMKKCVAQNEINACNKIKFVPVTIRDGNNDIVNDGVAIVGIVQN